MIVSVWVANGIEMNYTYYIIGKYRIRFNFDRQ